MTAVPPMTPLASETAENWSKLIRDVKDFPQPGILFKDITTLIKEGDAFRQVIGMLVNRYRGERIDRVVGVESRGFIFACPLAYELGAGFVPIRKPGKLPADVVKTEYELEYGSNTLELHRDAIEPGQQVLIVDDVLATGGSAAAAVRLVEELGGVVMGVAVVIELGFLKGRERLGGYDLFSLLRY
ncbi:MAG: adenine phosphoribosyltransferase [Chloroflexota bacterium]